MRYVSKKSSRLGVASKQLSLMEPLEIVKLIVQPMIAALVEGEPLGSKNHWHPTLVFGQI
jgi:hypothetical protein